jgi:hypothetical protein
VSEAQMIALFGHGRHPDRELPLGRAFAAYEERNEFRHVCGQRYAAWNTARGVKPSAPVPDEVRAAIWVHEIGRGTLVLIDEAGMAPTLELAHAVTHILSRGGSVRMIGDDQQLVAVAAGGILRELARHPATVTLSEVVRFTDPAEAAASIALRDGDPAALGYYLDHGRVHVADQATIVDAAYTAWAADAAAGRDALLLAPTRQLAAELNTRAQTDRHCDGPTGRGAELADGLTARAGDPVITRHNDRRLALGPTDWVKNGDRWAVTDVGRDGSLRVTHRASGRAITLPAAYVSEHVTLGYATTVHTAQGVTAEVSHTVLTGAETRQILYVAATRGRQSNYLHLAVPGCDGDPHAVLTRDAVLPPTATEVLTRILATDASERSASTTARDLADPATHLRDAAARYADALTRAGPQHAAELRAGPLPWLPPPPTVPGEPAWTSYLAAQASHLADLAAQVSAQTADWTPATAPPWASSILIDDPGLVADLAVWRAATGVSPSDRRPAGPQHPTANAHQDGLTDRYRAHLETRPGSNWAAVAASIDLRILADPLWPALKDHLAAAEMDGLTAADLTRLVAQRPLPTDCAAAALVWRLMHRHDPPREAESRDDRLTERPRPDVPGRMHNADHERTEHRRRYAATLRTAPAETHRIEQATRRYPKPSQPSNPAIRSTARAADLKEHRCRTGGQS